MTALRIAGRILSYFLVFSLAVTGLTNCGGGGGSQDNSPTSTNPVSPQDPPSSPNTPNQLTISLNPVNLPIAAAFSKYDQTITMTVSGGSSPYVYSCSISDDSGLFTYWNNSYSNSATCRVFGAPAQSGSYTIIITVTDHSAATATVSTSLHVDPDPDLEKGFPVKSLNLEGTYHGGPAIHTLVGNIDDSPTLEIIVTGLAIGPLYAWHSDGSPVAGWPSIDDYWCPAYPALGNLSNSYPGYEIFAGYMWCDSAHASAYSGSGKVLAGWPFVKSGSFQTPPALADIDGDGLDEIFGGLDDSRLGGFKADGSFLPGWPVEGSGGQERHTPAIADLDGDGQLEIITATDSNTPGVYLLAYYQDGKPAKGFPVSFSPGFPDTYPVVGDVDGDGVPEIIVVVSDYPNPSKVLILSNDGSIKHSMPIAGGIFYGAAPALADLDGDCIPEIIVQSNEALNAWRGDGSVFPGWPVFQGESGDYWAGNSAPVVGDVDGDGIPDIVVTNRDVNARGSFGDVRVYNRNGVLHPHFPKALKMGVGAVPAIADIDLDGHNEIIVSGDYWDAVEGFYDKVWVFDLGGPKHGSIEWGQFGGGPKHQGFYSCKKTGSSFTRRK